MNTELMIAIIESHSLLPEGAWTNEGLYWISPKGKVILVNTLDNKHSIGHEEYANVKWNCSLEDALHKGYVRVQAVSPQYLFIDHMQKLLRTSEVPAMTGFFYDQHMAEIPYNEMVIERAGDMRTFKKGQNNVALEFTITGDVEPEEPPETNNVTNALSALKQLDLDLVHPAYQRPGVNPLGDATNYSFDKWMRQNHHFID